MTDNERDQIDQDAQIFMRTCSEAIKQLRNEGVCLFYCAAHELVHKSYWKCKIGSQIMLILSCIVKHDATFKTTGDWEEIGFVVTFWHYTKTCEFVFNKWMSSCFHHSGEASDISPDKGAQRGSAGPHWNLSERWVHATHYKLNSTCLLYLVFYGVFCMHPFI